MIRLAVRVPLVVVASAVALSVLTLNAASGAEGDPPPPDPNTVSTLVPPDSTTTTTTTTPATTTTTAPATTTTTAPATTTTTTAAPRSTTTTTDPPNAEAAAPGDDDYPYAAPSTTTTTAAPRPTTAAPRPTTTTTTTTTAAPRSTTATTDPPTAEAAAPGDDAPSDPDAAGSDTPVYVASYHPGQWAAPPLGPLELLSDTWDFDSLLSISAPVTVPDDLEGLAYGAGPIGGEAMTSNGTSNGQSLPLRLASPASSERAAGGEGEKTNLIGFVVVAIAVPLLAVWCVRRRRLPAWREATVSAGSALAAGGAGVPAAGRRAVAGVRTMATAIASKTKRGAR